MGKVVVQMTDDTSEGQALKAQEPIISPDVTEETRFRYPPFLIENSVRATASVIIIGGQGRPPFGVLEIDSRAPRRFTDADTAFLRGYANRYQL